MDSADQSCSNCKYWGVLRAKGAGIEDGSAGPWPDEKPARKCKRFPPNQLWGANEKARAFGVGESARTFHDDWCAEWSQLQ